MLGYSFADLPLLRRFVAMSLYDRVMGSGLGIFGFKARLGGAETSLTYVAWLISGYAPWQAIGKGPTASVGSIVGNAALIKNLSFRAESPPLAAVLAALVPFAVGLVYLAAIFAVEGVAPSMSWLAMPVVLALQVLLVAGLALALSTINVFLRDVALVLPNLLLVLLVATAIFYPIDMFPERLRPVAALNSIHLIAEGCLARLLRGAWPSAMSLAVLGGWGLLCFAVGAFVFRRLKPLFDNRLREVVNEDRHAGAKHRGGSPALEAVCRLEAAR